MSALRTLSGLKRNFVSRLPPARCVCVCVTTRQQTVCVCAERERERERERECVCVRPTIKASSGEHASKDRK